MTHPAFEAGNTAVVTGAALGIGHAACLRFAAMGMNVCMVDIDGDALEAARIEVADVARSSVTRSVVDVGDSVAVAALGKDVFAEFGRVDVLFNNAVTRVGGGVWGDADEWRRSMYVNYWGPVNGVRVFVPQMIEQNSPGLVINAGSKPGITNPPGNAAYNVTKAALKHYTESLQHELRNTEKCQISSHLLVPGWTRSEEEAQARGAWVPAQVVDFMMDALATGDFYIVCPDGETTAEMDKDRIRWAAGDVSENRPPLSRWHPDFKTAFESDSR